MFIQHIIKDNQVVYTDDMIKEFISYAVQNEEKKHNINEYGRYGTCGSVAHALYRFFRTGKFYALIENNDINEMAHVVVLWRGMFWDSKGYHYENDIIDEWREICERERCSTEEEWIDSLEIIEVNLEEIKQYTLWYDNDIIEYIMNRLYKISSMYK